MVWLHIGLECLWVEYRKGRLHSKNWSLDICQSPGNRENEGGKGLTSLQFSAENCFGKLYRNGARSFLSEWYTSQNVSRPVLTSRRWSHGNSLRMLPAVRSPISYTDITPRLPIVVSLPRIHIPRPCTWGQKIKALFCQRIRRASWS